MKFRELKKAAERYQRWKLINEVKSRLSNKVENAINLTLTGNPMLMDR